MNVADLLSYADIEQLNRMAERLDCRCNTHSKNELIQTLLMHMKRRGIFGTELHELPDEELLFLFLLVFDSREWFSTEELLAKAHTAVKHCRTTRPVRNLIAEAMASGWLFRGIDRRTCDLFRIPRDMSAAVVAKIRSVFVQRLQTPLSPPSVWRDEGDCLLTDIRTFLAYVHQHAVPLTAEKVMYKRHLQQILKRLAIQETPPEPGWRFGYGYHFRHYPDRFSLIYDVCLVSGYIREDDFLTVTEKGVAVLRRPADPDMVSAYRTWMRIYKYPIPLLPVLTHLIGLLCEQWVLLPSLLAVVRPWLNGFYYEPPERVFEMRIIKMMMHLGLLQMGASPEGTAVRTSPAGRKLLERVKSFDATPLPTPPVAR